MKRVHNIGTPMQKNGVVLAETVSISLHWHESGNFQLLFLSILTSWVFRQRRPPMYAICMMMRKAIFTNSAIALLGMFLVERQQQAQVGVVMSRTRMVRQDFQNRTLIWSFG